MDYLLPKNVLTPDGDSALRQMVESLERDNLMLRSQEAVQSLLEHSGGLERKLAAASPARTETTCVGGTCV